MPSKSRVTSINLTTPEEADETTKMIGKRKFIVTPAQDPLHRALTEEKDEMDA